MRNHRHLIDLARLVGALAVLTAGADHLEEYTANQFSTVPTIGILFLLNFVAATVVGVGLLAPLGLIAPRLASALRALLALAGIGIAVASLAGLWISEQSSLFGFTDHGFRAAVAVAVAAEAAAVLSLVAYLALAGIHLRAMGRPRPSASSSAS